LGFDDFDFDGVDGGKGAEEFGGDSFGEGFDEVAGRAGHDGADGVLDGAVVDGEVEVVGAAGGGEGEFEADSDFEDLAVGFFLGEQAVEAEVTEAGKGEGVRGHGIKFE